MGFDPVLGDPVSTSSLLRRKEARRREKAISMESIHTTAGNGKKNYRAVIHADGNNIGITIGRILQQTPDYETGIRTRRAIGEGLKTTIGGIMSRTLHDLENYYHQVTGRPDGFDEEFLVVHVAGDDINCVCNAIWAFPFFHFFYQNLKGAFVWKNDTMEVPLYVCGGIAFVTENHAYHPAFSLAEECCSNAKKYAKKECNLRNGLAGNWIDFQILDNPNSQNLEMLREQSYITPEQISLLARPYCLDPEFAGQETSYQRLMHRVRMIKALDLDPYEKMLLRRSYMIGREEFKAFMSRMRSRGVDLASILGSPLFTDSDKQQHAAWFDATELSDFILPEFAQLSDTEAHGEEERL